MNEGMNAGKNEGMNADNTSVGPHIDWNLLELIGLRYLDAENSIALSLTCKRLYALLGYKSLSPRIDRRGAVTRFFLRNYSKIKWAQMCTNPNMPLAFIERHLQLAQIKQHWFCACWNPGATVEFIERNEHFIVDNTNELGANVFTGIQTIPSLFFEQRFHSVKWALLCYNESLGREFFERNIEHIEWSPICCNRSIGVEFFESHIDQVRWPELCQNTSIPMWFFEKYFDKIVWPDLCRNTSVPIEFFELHIDKVYWWTLCANSSVPVEFLKRHGMLDVNSEYRVPVCRNPSLPKAYFEQIRTGLGHREWINMCRNPATPMWVFEQLIDHIEWTYLCLNPSISVEFFERYIDKIDWHSLCQNPTIPIWFFEKNIDKVVWSKICANTFDIRRCAFRTKYRERYSHQLDGPGVWGICDY